MLELTTERLRLIALDPEHMRLRLRSRKRMERGLGLQPTPRVVYGDAAYNRATREAIRDATKRMENDERTWAWHTFWQVVLRRDNQVVGEFDFHGPPNRCGEVEFGYATRPKHRNQGYMTEAARALTTWALEQAQVSALVAETAKDNKASQRVLLKLGAHLVGQTKTDYQWRLVR